MYNLLEDLPNIKDIDDLENLLKKINQKELDDFVREDESVYKTDYEEKIILKDLKDLDLSKFEKQKNLKSIEIEILEEIKERLLNGKSVYQKNWFDTTLDNRNYLSKNKYNGINELYLSIIKNKLAYSSSYWLTFSQMLDLNKDIEDKNKKIHLKKGSKGHKIIFPLVYDKNKERGYSFSDFEKLPLEEKKELLENGDIIITKKEYVVFNASCFENLDLSFEKEEILENLKSNKNFKESLKNKEDLIKFSSFMGVGLEFVSQNRAFYRPDEDRIYLPSEEQFLSENALKTVFFHELSHATGHEKRLNRKIKNSKFSKKYAFEEVVAETSSFILASKFDFDTDEIKNNNAEYINSWARRLINSPEKVISAIRKGIEAKDYILKEKENFELLNDINKSLSQKDFLNIFKDKEFVFSKSFEKELKEKNLTEKTRDTVSQEKKEVKKKENSKKKVKKKSKVLSM